MLAPFYEAKVHLAVGITDLRKSINGLSILVADQLGRDPLSGHLFGFCNRKRDLVKILYWDRNGFCLWQKRLEKDKFRWPDSPGDVVSVGRRELNWLLDGLTIDQQYAHEYLEYAVVF